MRKIYRSLIWVVLAAVIAAGMPLTASAAMVMPVPSPEQSDSMPSRRNESPEGSMETALIAVASLFDIDSDVYTDFSYSSNSSSGRTEDVIWSFSWSSDTRNAYIYAYVTEDGTVIQFRKFAYEEQSFGFAEVGMDEAVAIADGFIAKANPDSYEFYKAPAEVTININNSEYSISYFAESDGYAFTAAQLSVSINKFTGEITGYATSNINPERFRFESAASLISESDAIIAYAGKIGLSLEYRSYFDYERGTITVFPVYLFDEGGNKFISAVSGNVVELVIDTGTVAMDAAYGLSGGAGSSAPRNMTEENEDGGDRSALSAAEISALDRVSGFLSSEQALQKLLETAGLEDIDMDSFSERYINLNRDYMDRDRYFYDVMLYAMSEHMSKENDIQMVYGRVHAETGRVFSFTISYAGAFIPDEQNDLTEEQVKAAVDEFLERAAPDELEKSGFEGSERSYRGDSYGFNYYRIENGIPFRSNGISVTINQHSGKIMSYSLNWFDNVSFPGVEDVIEPHEALAEFAAQVGTTITYVTTGRGNAALVYGFKNRSLIDPFTGAALDYNGRPWVDNDVTPEYGDVSGHWSENLVLTLLNNGVYLWGGSFEPDKAMTEMEFMQYILLIESYYAPIEPLAYLAMRGLNIELDADAILTRQRAAKIVVEYLGYGKLGEQYEWFSYPFSDAAGAEYKGYITICYMLGIVSGNNGVFNATGSITRSQAASILYNLILSKS